MGGTGTDRATVSTAGGGSILTGVRVATKPAFAIVVAAALALGQDLFQRVTHIPLTADEAVEIVTLGSWLAYFLVPVSMQDGGAVVVTAPAALPPAAPAS